MKYYAVAETCYTQGLNDDNPDRDEQYPVVLINLGLYCELAEVKRKAKNLNRKAETRVYTWVELKVQK